MENYDGGDSSKREGRRKSLFHASKALTQKIIVERLDFLAPSANNKLVFVELDLSGLKLTDINALSGYVHLQVLKLASNSLTSLAVLSKLSNLIYLDVGFNRNHKLFDFDAPTNLREANYNHNVVGTIPMLANFWTLTKLHLDHNNIRRISYGLLFCKQLTFLSLRGNDIKVIDNLHSLPLRVLLLSDNDISEIENLENLVYLEVLDLASNNIRDLGKLKGHYYLNNLDIGDNEIRSLNELAIFGKLPALRILNLEENPICDNRMYRNIVLATQPSLLVLDHRELTVEEKVKAISQISPKREIVSVRDRFVNTVYTFLQPLKVRPSTPSARYFSFPCLLLVGPLGSLKKPLLERIIEEFPNFWGRLVPHTTRPIRRNEISGIHYHFVNLREFERLHQSGEFIETTFLYGEHYGLSWKSLDDVAKKGLYPIGHTELEAMVTLKLTHFRLYLIVVMAHDINIHKTRLETVLGLNETTVQEAMGRRKMYFDYYNFDPGLFTMNVNTDNPEVAYNNIKLMIISIQNEIIDNLKSNLNSIVQWRPLLGVDQNNKLEIASMEFRWERARQAFTHNRAGKLFPTTHQLEVPVSEDSSDYTYTPKSELS